MFEKMKQKMRQNQREADIDILVHERHLRSAIEGEKARKKALAEAQKKREKK